MRCDDPECRGWVHMDNSMGWGPGIEACDVCGLFLTDEDADTEHHRSGCCALRCRSRQQQTEALVSERDELNRTRREAMDSLLAKAKMAPMDQEESPDPALAERAAVVAWLRVKRDDADSMTRSGVIHGATTDALAMFLARAILRDAADAIERGEHVVVLPDAHQRRSQ